MTSPSISLSIQMPLILCRMLRRVVWLLMISVALLATASGHDYVIAVDVSGSMRWPVLGRDTKESPANRKRIEVVREALENFVTKLPADSRLVLIQFATGVTPAQEFRLDAAAGRAAAVAWVRALAPPADSETHLYLAIRSALVEMRRILREKRGEQVVVRIYTDGKNEDGSAREKPTLTQVLDGFPEMDGKALRPDLVLLSPDLSVQAIAKIKREAEPRMLVTNDPKAQVPLPPIIDWTPNPIIEDREVLFVENSEAPYSSYAWTLDGVAQKGGKSLKLASLKAGKHTVSLKVKHLIGITDTAVQVFDVFPEKMPPPDAAFTTAPMVFTVGDTVVFTAKADAAGWKHEWIIGTTKLEGKVAQWKSDRDGQFNVVHRVVAPHATSEATVEIAGSKMVLDASFAAEPLVVVLGESVSLKAKADQPGWQHEWQIGADVKLAGSEVKWKSDRLGTLPVMHRIITPQAKNEATAQIVVQPVPLPDAAFEVSPPEVTLRDKATFRAKLAAGQHEWEVAGEKLTGATAQWKSSREGLLVVKHTIITPQGKNEATEKLLVKSELPKPAFSASPKGGAAPLDVKFTDRSTKPSLIAKYDWDFGDGTPHSEDKNPAHTYAAPGEYTVQLTITTTDKQPLKAAEPLTIKVTPPPPWYRKYWWLWPLLLLVLILLKKLKAPPLFGKLKWSFQGKDGEKVLTGSSFPLKALGVAGWQPKENYVVKLIDGRVTVVGTKQTTLDANKPRTFEGLTITLITNIR